jgi:hypothetical protein
MMGNLGMINQGMNWGEIGLGPFLVPQRNFLGKAEAVLE